MTGEKSVSTTRSMTRAELLDLPAAIDLDTANRALALGRTKGYELAKQGKYPCTVLHFGNVYRVITADLLRLLQIEERPARAAEDEREAA